MRPGLEDRGADGQVRGTQSLVHTLGRCWRRPSLTAVEVLWRWAYGVPAMWAILQLGKRAVSGVGVDWGALKGMSVMDPMGAAAVLAEALARVSGPVGRVAVWLGPVLYVGWVVVSSLGRTLVLRRAEPRLVQRPGTLMALAAVRVGALAAVFGLWFACLQGAARVTVTGPLAAGAEPNVVLYCAMAIVVTLGLFMLWAAMSWVLSVAPLLAMLRGLGFGASLRAALRLGALKGKLVEINLVMGIIKIALIVLAMVFSATPLPFEGVATETFLLWWWAGVTVLYLVASDFFHVARLVAYLELWRAYEMP